MQLHNLKKNRANRKAKQVGRGGTRGKTSGRGTKGQNARSGRKKRPEMRDIIKRLPKLRGRGKNFLKTRFSKTVPVSLALIEKNFAAGDTVSRETLAEKGMIKRFNGKLPYVKILGAGKLSKEVKLEVPISHAAAKVVEKVEKKASKKAATPAK